MKKYIIFGGKPLEGTVEISGGKNAALPILAASVLNSDISVVYNCPRIADIKTSIDILKEIGCKTDFDENTILIDSSTLNKTEVPQDLAKKMRSSIIFAGALLSRCKEVTVFQPGGCELGNRPIDIHLDAFKKLGAEIVEKNGKITIKAKELKGTSIKLKYPSVGATQNIMLASVLANGTTVIENAAKEPEICDLALFLIKSGADIQGAGTETVVIKGVKELSHVRHFIIPDRIEAGTFLSAAAVTGGRLFLKNVSDNHIFSITEVLAQAGCIISSSPAENGIYIEAPKRLYPVAYTQTAPYPAFPTDMQPQITAILTKASGTSTIQETVFKSRTSHINELLKMGADIKIKGNKFIIKGKSSLHGADLYAKDLRCGAALIVAGLCAENKTTILNGEHIERGYDSIEKKLRAVGADIYLA